MIEALAKEIRQTIEHITGRKKSTPERKFHKHDEYLSYGMSSSDFSEALKDTDPVFSN